MCCLSWCPAWKKGVGRMTKSKTVICSNCKRKTVEIYDPRPDLGYLCDDCVIRRFREKQNQRFDEGME